MQRKVTPAARAALTRRRQRAAALPRTHSNRATPVNAPHVETEETHELPVKEVISSSVRGSSKRNASHAPESTQKTQSNIPSYPHPPQSPKSTLSRSKTDSGSRGKPPTKEIIHGSPKSLSPLAQRAVQSLQRTNFSSGGTMTTTGLTASSASRSASHDVHEIESHETKCTIDVDSSVQQIGSGYSALQSRTASANGSEKQKIDAISSESSDSGLSRPKLFMSNHDARSAYSSKSPRKSDFVGERVIHGRRELQQARPNQHEDVFHGGTTRMEVTRSDSPLEARMRKLEASETSNQRKLWDDRYSGQSPARRPIEPTGREVGGHVTLSSPLRERGIAGNWETHSEIGGKQLPSTSQLPYHGSPEEGPLLARTMKMAGTDSRNQSPQTPRQASPPFVIPRRNNSRDGHIGQPSNGRKSHEHESPPSQFNLSRNNSPLWHVPTNKNNGESGLEPFRRKIVLSPRDTTQRNPQQSRSLFEKSFATSRMPASPSGGQKTESNKSQSPILRRNITPRPQSRNRPSVASPRITADNPAEARNALTSGPAMNGSSGHEDNARGKNSFSQMFPAYTTAGTRQGENNGSRSIQRQRPSPIDTKSASIDPNGTNSKYKSSPYRSPANHGFPSPSTSPGVQQLSAILMDSYSATDVSTIPDLNYRKRGASTPSSQNISHKPSYSIGNGNIGSPRFDRGANVDSYENPIATDGWHHDCLDATCLLSGCFVMIKAYGSNSSIRARKGDTFGNYFAERSGHCLSREDDLVVLTKASPNRLGDENGEIRHGDTVVLRSVFAQRNLGIRKQNRGAIHSPLELGFFSSDESPGSQWTVLMAKTAKEVLVGKAAVKESASSAMSQGKPLFLRSGDPILLRNIHSGGILSIDSTGSVVLLTDSYNQSTNYVGSSEDPSLIGRLQQHNKLLPSRSEIFQLVIRSTPPCPPWISGKDSDHRIFLSGSYLMQPQRNQRSASFEAGLFVGSSQSSILSNRRSLGGLGHMPGDLREKVLMDEVIGSFLGLEGKHIRLKGAKGRTCNFDDFEFQLFDADGVSFDISLRNLVDQILPLSTSFVRVRNFVASHHPGYEYGKIMHAFCEGLDGLLQDYVSYVSQLERHLRRGDSKAESLTMKNIYFQITSSLHSMSILEHATKAVTDKKGGSLLNALRVLDTRVYMGDVVARKVLGILLEKASEPYLDMMTEWLQSGVLHDQYGEFMVGRSQTNNFQAKSLRFDRDAWTDHFVIKDEHVLEVVSAEWIKEKVMTTGKYWNAVQACNTYDSKLSTLDEGDQLSTPPINSDSSTLSSYIESRYQSASQALVQLLMNDFNLMASLQVVKRYFLLDQGDFLMNFLDEAEPELLKDSSSISLGRVQHWLSMSIQAVETSGDDDQGFDFSQQHRDFCKLTPAALTCRFATDGMIGHLDTLLASGAIPGHNAVESTHDDRIEGLNSGIEAFVIDFDRIPFPTSLVLSKQTMETYKLLFRHLFFAKHVERRLVGVWRDHQSLKNLQSVRGLLGRTFLLRQRMLHFLQNLLYYMSFEVIESNWTEMLSAIDHSSVCRGSTGHRDQTVDDILRIHNDFLRQTMDACLLTNRELFRSLTKLMNTCLLFSDQMKRFMSSTRIVSIRRRFTLLRYVDLHAHTPCVWSV